MTRTRRSSASSRGRSRRATATASTATSSGTSRTSAAGCARRPRVTARSATRSRRTCTATSWPPPTRRSMLPTARPRCSSAPCPAAAASSRNENSNHRPLAFLRALGCVDAKFKKLTPAAARASSRAGATASRSTRTASSPRRRPVFPNADDISIASLVTAHVACSTSSAKAKRLKGNKSKLDLYLDEFGYQTNPPDKFTGITLAQQDQWLQRAAYQAWRDPRVKLFAQYLWIDEPRSLNNENGGWQSGVCFADGRAKPASSASRSRSRSTPPAAAVGPGAHARDPAPSRSSANWRARRAGAELGTRRTDAQGYWSWTTRLTVGASYRFQAAGATSAALKRRCAPRNPRASSSAGAGGGVRSGVRDERFAFRRFHPPPERGERQRATRARRVEFVPPAHETRTSRGVDRPSSPDGVLAVDVQAAGATSATLKRR